MPHPNRNKVRDWPEFLASFRASHDLSQKQLADKLQISARTVQDWEYGRGQPAPYLRLELQQLANPLANLGQP